MANLHKRARDEWKNAHDGRYQEALREHKRQCQERLFNALEIPYMNARGQIDSDELALLPAHDLLPTERYWWGKIAGKIRDLQVVFDTDGEGPTMHRISKCSRCDVDVATNPPFSNLVELGAAIQAGAPSHHECARVVGMPPEPLVAFSP